MKVGIFLGILTMMVWGLEIDEKLTTRILKTSATKKTVLLNRGLEDGLVVGDHAKFFLTSGVVARGVIVQASPARSIWSIYRLIDSEEIVVDKVLKLKISSPVKLTEDPTKMLVAEDKVEEISETIADVKTAREADIPAIPLAEGADDLPKDLNADEKRELDSLRSSGRVASRTQSGVFRDKTLEAWGLAYYSGLSTSSEQGTTTTQGKCSTLDFSLGVEKYFNSPKSFFDNVSLFGFITKSGIDMSSADTNTESYDVFGYGGGINYHFGKGPFVYNNLNWFASFSAGMASVESTSSTTAGNTTTLSGSALFFSGGAGVKYYSASGWGGRVLLDYYYRGESYEMDGGDVYTTAVTGPRLQFGLSYRW